MDTKNELVIDKDKLYYLSHPYTTFGDPELNKKRAKQLEIVLEVLYGIKVINPIVLPLGPSNDRAMEQCRHLYNACDGGVIFCPYWEKSTGCNEEYGWAAEDKKPIFVITDNYKLKRFGLVG
ncbi:MAG TPA: DUF4406 domain-containing protein [Candidatus Nitrosocosmicus sp.]|nr:DUF4406 domain-containing protein [Candidatus Nitrosocosmicus sp.]